MKKLKLYSQKDIYIIGIAIILLVIYLLYKYVLHEYILIIILYTGIYIGIGLFVRKCILLRKNIRTYCVYDFIFAFTVIVSLISIPEELMFKLNSIPTIVVIFIIFPVVFSYFKKEVIYNGDKNFQIKKDFQFSYIITIMSIIGVIVIGNVINKF